MSEAPSNTPTADVDPTELNDIAAGLYALRPDAFAAARDEEIRKARAEGKQPVARELGKLHRPTQSAWLVNLLWRNHRDEMEALLQLADKLTQAQTEGSGEELLRLAAQRRDLEASLLRRASALARQADVKVSPTMEREVQETIGAALVERDVADEIRTGRLVKPASYAGFGPDLALMLTPNAALRPRAEKPGAPERPAPRPSTGKDPAHEAEGDRPREPGGDRGRAEAEGVRREAREEERREAERLAAERQDRREEAERRVEEARATLDAAANMLGERRSAAEHARGLHADLLERAEQARHELRRLETETTAAERAARDDERAREQAERAHDLAARLLATAERDLKDLPTR